LPLDETAFEKTLTPIIQEYFEHGDTNEVAVGFKLQGENTLLNLCRMILDYSG
jgi:hypothetical protein